MDYEKKYKEALGWMQSLYKGLHGVTKEDAEHFFPELKESEEERNQRIKKEVIEMLNYYHSKSNCFNPPQFSLEETLAWLEKQGEQNHCNGEVNDEALQRQFQIWFDKGKCSGLDEVIFHPEDFGLKKQDEQKRVVNSDNIKKAIHIYLDWLDGKKDIAPKGEYSIRDMIDWLKSLENRVQPCPKQEWSEEDEKMRNKILQHLGEFHAEYPELYIKDEFDWLESIKPQPKQKWSKDDEDMINGILYDIDYIRTINRNIGGKEDIFDKEENWLKSLKPQSHWKPTEEQMNELEKLIVWADELYDENSIRTIESLYNDIKKL